jgi:uncharacterized Tic20 family protein
MTNLKNSVSRVTTQMSGKENLGNTITVTLWIIALSTHLILMPLLIRELYQEFVHGQKHKDTLFQK